MIWSVRDMATINYPDPSSPDSRARRSKERKERPCIFHISDAQPAAHVVAPLLPAKRRPSFYNTGSLCFESYPLLLEGVGESTRVLTVTFQTDRCSRGKCCFNDRLA